jgi:signal transduction histidine kinase
MEYPMGRAVTAWLRAGYGPRTWRELAYVLTGFPLALIAFTGTVLPLALGVGLAVVYAGLPLVAAQLVVARAFGDLARRRARWLLGVRVDGPPALRRTGSPRTGLADAAGWRAVLYVLVAPPVALLGWGVAGMLWGLGLAWFSYPAWFHAAPASMGDIVFDTWPQALEVMAAGTAVLLLAPWPVRAVVLLDRLAIAGLLAPTRTARRLRDLEATRSHAVTGSSERLRRIERDLHDGAQARLVAVAMDLGVARDILESRPDDDQVRRLVDLAHANANTAISELRDLARGIHPPALDDGLDTALATLCSRTPVPVDLRVELDRRPEPAIEAIVYFCAAELLVNAVKHSRAGRVAVEVTGHGPAVRLAVRDDGVGGAVVTGDGGLAGLRDRLRTVDGTLGLTSPPGGPTGVEVRVPTRA